MNSGTTSSAPAGSSKKATVYVAGLAPQISQQELLDAFVSFGDIIEINMPMEAQDSSKHRGYAFITFSNPADAQDAIDNYDLNELPGYRGQGRFLKCSVANPNKYGGAGGGEGSGGGFKGPERAVWESEEWLQKYAKPTGNGDAANGADGAAPPAEAEDDE